MATRSLIILDKGINFKKRYEYVYCHWDGYPEGVGKTLYDHYNTNEKIQELIDLGFISSLRESISNHTEFEHTFDNPLPGVTVFYGRDRGEEDVNKLISKSIPLDSEFGTDYRYIFTNGQWFVSEFGKENELFEWESLEHVLDTEDYNGEALGNWSGVVSKKKKKLASLLSEEPEDSFKDAVRYIIEHYLSENDVKNITNDLYEGV